MSNFNDESKINSDNQQVNAEAQAAPQAQAAAPQAVAKPAVQGNGFDAFGLPASLMASLNKIGFTSPTPIQARALPIALSGKDILGSAQTGTGKTGAFAIPTIAKLIADPEATALILTPTRELATQVFATIKPLLGNDVRNIRTALLIGGEFIGKQLSQLRNNPRLVIGTPGRVNDHLQRKSLNLSKVAVFILDETDRMLDLGFGIQIEHIARTIPAERQTLLFSATMPSNIMQLSKRYLKNPEVIAIEPEKVTTANVKQTFLKVSESEKYDQLVTELDTRSGSVIVFVKTKMGSEKMAKRLSNQGHLVDVIHGDLRQSRRDRVIKNFRSQEFRILIATDVAARGLDIPHIEHVINHDLPQCPEDYVHRIGRTGRNGATGAAISFVSPSESGKFRDIDRMLNPENYKGQGRNGNDGHRGNGGERRGGGRGGFGGGQRRSNNDGPFGGFKSRDENRGGFGGERREGRGGFDNRGGERREGRNFDNRGERGSFGGERREGRNFDNRGGDNRRFGGEKRGGERSFGGERRDREDSFNRAPRSNRDDNFGNVESASHHQYREEDLGNRVDNFADKKGFNHNNRPRSNNGGGFKGGFKNERAGGERKGNGFGGARKDGQRSGAGGGFRGKKSGGRNERRSNFA